MNHCKLQDIQAWPRRRIWYSGRKKDHRMIQHDMILFELPSKQVLCFCTIRELLGGPVAPLVAADPSRHRL
jgi:hypothetical protein